MNDDRRKELEQLAERLIWHVETMRHWTGVAADQMVKEARAALAMKTETETETERTPGNWEVELRGDQVYVEVEANDDERQWIVATCHGPLAEANAAFIVKACNSFGIK